MNFWTWQTTEVRDMITWMRQHNQNPGSDHKVSFHGFDMQDVTLAVDYVVAYVRKVDPSEAQRVQELYSCIASLGLFPTRYTELPQEAKAECRARLETVHDHLESHRENYEQLSTQREFANALHGAQIVLQVEECYAQPSCAVRDRYMAENSAWLLEQGGPGAKIVLWAHNAHVGRLTESTPEYKWGSMGHHLRERFGEEAVIFGFDFHSGSFNAVTMRDNQFMGLNVHQVEPPPADSYEHYFAGAGIPRMFLDLRGVDTSLPETSWLQGPHPMRSIGSVYDRSTPERWFTEARLLELFDVLIYFQDTTASGLLR
jgi:erythromycin esterase